MLTILCVRSTSINRTYKVHNSPTISWSGATPLSRRIQCAHRSLGAKCLLVHGKHCKLKTQKFRNHCAIQLPIPLLNLLALVHLFSQCVQQVSHLCSKIKVKSKQNQKRQAIQEIDQSIRQATCFYPNKLKPPSAVLSQMQSPSIAAAGGAREWPGSHCTHAFV